MSEFENAHRWMRPWCWLRGHRWWGGLGMYACVRCDKDWTPPRDPQEGA